MVIAFLGHSDFIGWAEYESTMMHLLKAIIGEEAVDFYLGGYGNFDSFAYECCRKYKLNNKRCNLVFVTPYVTEEYQRTRLQYEKERYDCILYPEIEDKPLRFAITYRNRAMIDSADVVIAFIRKTYGGAYKTYRYAIGKNKTVINLADEEALQRFCI
ncbi:MAG: hypothetical protein J6C09_07875 [Clostridia bacterium]|nr:hypothetical protein [Clostridia bacterium]